MCDVHLIILQLKGGAYPSIFYTYDYYLQSRLESHSKHIHLNNEALHGERTEKHIANFFYQI